MITVTVDKIDGTDITNDIRAVDPAMIVNGSVRPSTVNTAGSACIMDVLTWDGNIQNYRAVRWTLTDTYTTIKSSLNLVTATLVKVNGETVTTDIRAINSSMLVAGSMRPLTANNTATAAVFSILKWNNNTFTQIAEEWQANETYASMKTSLDALDNTPYGAATGTDTYAVTLAPAMTAYETGVPFRVKFANANTGAATLNVNGLGAKALKKAASVALDANDIVAGEIYSLVYDGTNIQIDIEEAAIPYGAAAGTDTYTVTTVPATLAYQTGRPFFAKYANTNTGAATLNVNGLGAKDLKKSASTALAASDIVVGRIYRHVYDGTNIQVDIPDGVGSTISYLTIAAAPIKNTQLAFVAGTKTITPDVIGNVTAETQVIVHHHSYGTGAMGVRYQVDINVGADIIINSVDGAGGVVATDDSNIIVSVFNVA